MIARTTTTTATVAAVTARAAAVGPRPRARRAAMTGERAGAISAASTIGTLKNGATATVTSSQVSPKTTSSRQLHWPSRSSHNGTSGFADAWWPMVPRLSTIAGANA